MKPEEIENIEIDLLLQGIHRRYGYDFRNYSKASLKRRLKHQIHSDGFKTTTDFLSRILYDENLFDNFLRNMSVTVSEFFRDPTFFKGIKKKVIPILKTYPYINIWHAGCATGEEVYSMMIFLEEQDMLKRSQIYATDFNTNSLEIAKKGVYPLHHFKTYSKNYIKAGGKTSFSDYYTAKYTSAKLHEYLKEHVTFAYHNLVTDRVFAEMNLILCRNVLIYFDKTLQNQVLSLFAESLCHRGFLCLGDKESLDFLDISHLFKPLLKREKIYRKR